MANVNLGIDNAYNAPLRKLTQELERMQIIRLQPQMLGGGPLREYVLPGQSGAYPVEIPRETGGAMRTALRPIKSPKDALMAVESRRLTGGVSRIKKAQKWTDYSLDTAEKGLGLASKAVGMFGGVSRSKKAKKWTDYSVDTVDKGLGLASKAVGMFGGVSRIKKAKKWTDYSVDTVDKGLGLASKAVGMFGAGARKDLPAGAAATKAHMKALRDMQDRAPIFVKGSPEALAHMAKLRAKRRTKAELDAERAAEREAAGLPPKEKRPPSARAAIVKQVMADQGLSMIEASKYVKANGLYVKQ